MTFQELVERSRKPGESPYVGTLLSIDPGHTTGWCVFEGVHLKDCGQLNTDVIDAQTLKELNLLFDRFPLTECVFEDYRVYKWRLEQHSFSDLHTPKLIGAIQTVCLLRGIEYHKQPASVAKQFVTDDKLKEWGFWKAGQRHARDAIRHACYFITFGRKEEWPKRPRKSGKTVG